MSHRFSRKYSRLHTHTSDALTIFETFPPYENTRWCVTSGGHEWRFSILRRFHPSRLPPRASPRLRASRHAPHARPRLTATVFSVLTVLHRPTPADPPRAWTPASPGVGLWRRLRRGVGLRVIAFIRAGVRVGGPSLRRRARHLRLERDNLIPQRASLRLRFLRDGRPARRLDDAKMIFERPARPPRRRRRRQLAISRVPPPIAPPPPPPRRREGSRFPSRARPRAPRPWTPSLSPLDGGVAFTF